MSHRILAVCGAASVLAGCHTTPDEPIVRTVTVNVPVAVSCVPANARVEPDFKISRADVAAAASPEERYRLTAAGFLERDAFVAEAVPVLRGCRD